MSKIKRRIVVVIGVLMLYSLVAFTRGNPASNPELQGAFPRGIIIAWNAKAGSTPSGWAVCDGTNGTPDLRRRFLMGVATLADVGQTAGNAAHSHSIIGGTSTARSKPDGWGFEATANRSRPPSVTGLDHSHTFTAISTEVSNIPPSYTVIFLMKL